jgi:hypothetical protein
MFKKGPIPPFVHGVLDYALAALLIASPFLFSFEANAAVAIGVVAGVVVLVIAACTAWTAGIIKSIPVPAHAMLDLALAALLIASPFLFGFTDDDAATPFFIVAGVVELLLAISTRYTPESREPRRRRDATPV